MNDITQSEDKSIVPPPSSQRSSLHNKRRVIALILVLLLVAVIGGVYFRGQLTIDSFRAHHQAVQDWVARYPLISAVIIIAVYAVIAALSIPIGSVLTIFIGFVFGAKVGTVLTVIGATLGATGLFLFVRSIANNFRKGFLASLAKSVLFLGSRTSMVETLKNRYGSFAGGLVSALDHHAFFYLLSLRLIPVFPFWLVNLIAAFFNIRLAPFVAATIIGIIPGTFVFALLGSGLDAAFQRGDSVDISSAISPELIWGLIGLGFLSLVPPIVQVWHKRCKARRR